VENGARQSLITTTDQYKAVYDVYPASRATRYTLLNGVIFKVSFSMTLDEPDFNSTPLFKI